MQSGWGHRKTLLAEIALMLAVCAAALGGMRLSDPQQNGVLLAVAASYAGLIVVIERSFGLQKSPHV